MRLWPRKRVYVDDLPRTHDARFMLVLLALLAGTLGAVYVIGYVAAGDKVPSRTAVAGIDIGSMNRDEAAATLTRAMDGRLTTPVVLKVDGRSLSVIPADDGIAFDVDATLDEAMGGGDWDPAHMMKVVGGGGDVDPVFRVDRTSLSEVLTPLATKVEHDPVNTTITVSGDEPMVHAGTAGGRLDVERAASALYGAVADGKTTVRLHLTPVPAAVDVEAAKTFVDGTLRPALAGPVVVNVGQTPISVPPTRFGPALRVDESGGSFRLGIDAAVLNRHTRSSLNSVAGRPVSARVTIQNGAPVVVPGHAGVEVTPDAWADAVLTAATVGDGRHAVAKATRANPPVTTSEARSWQITAPAGEASEVVLPRTAGALAAAARALDGALVMPGESFSFVREVGPGSADTVLGPLGQAAQSAAERAHMTITQWPLISPEGNDLGFRNTSAKPVLVHSWVAGPTRGRTYVYVQLWGSGSP